MKQYHIPYGKQSIDNSDLEAVENILKADFLTQGPAIAQFENNFSARITAPYSIAVSNGTTALHLCIKALNLDKNKTVLTTPITFLASANAARYENLKVDFVDIDPLTGIIDLDLLQKKINLNPDQYSCVVAVSYSGIPVDTKRLASICLPHGIKTIEDACHAPGAYTNYDNNEKVISGSCKYTDLATFSFHPVKHIACGEGGMVNCASEALMSRIQTLRTHGIERSPSEKEPWLYQMFELGYNYRLTDIQATLGISQLKKLDSSLSARNKIAQVYRKELSDLPLEFLKESDHFFNAYHLFVIKLEKRLELYNYLRERNIFCQVHYIPVHTQPYYKELGFEDHHFPQSIAFYKKILSIPMYPSLSTDEQNYVIKYIKAFFEE